MRALVMAMLLGLSVAHGVKAQQDPETQARELFLQGVQALEDLRFAEARDLFRESFDLFPTVGTAFNLGLAERGIGGSLAAVQIWTRLLDGELGEISDEQRTQVETLREELRRTLAALEVTTQADVETSLQLNSEVVGVVAPGEVLTLRVDPRQHRLTARAEGYEVLERSLTLSQGEHLRVDLSLTPISAPPAETPSARRAWLWAMISVVVVAAAAVPIVYFATRPGEAQSMEPFGIVVTP